MLSTVVCALLGLIYLGSSAAFNAFTGGACYLPRCQRRLMLTDAVATICLGCSYAFPVLCSLLRWRQMVQDATFRLGKLGYAIVSISDQASTGADH